jgi:2-keto-4-pentenoate hydratase/2-oxohepta-3-ene-1,7-dioic acid hydratase in catechol pathway
LRLATFTQAGRRRVGVVDGDAVVDLSVAAPRLPREMLGLIAAGPAALARAARAAKSGRGRLPLAAVRLEAPIPRPPKFIASGLNYADHIAEARREKPAFPPFFGKQVTAVNGPYDAIHRPRVSEQLDYEGELALVIGRRCRHVPRSRAPEVIFGYVIVNDVSVRDWQRKTTTPMIGKSFDTHAPMGPWLVTADEIPDPHRLRLRTWVNGELRQDSNTSYLINDCYDLIAALSTAMTLEPGDVIATGTPGGVAAGFDPPKFLKAGDVVRVEIEGIGHIENRVIEEPPETARIE